MCKTRLILQENSVNIREIALPHGNFHLLCKFRKIIDTCTTNHTRTVIDPCGKKTEKLLKRILLTEFLVNNRGYNNSPCCFSVLVTKER